MNRLSTRDTGLAMVTVLAFLAGCQSPFANSIQPTPEDRSAPGQRTVLAATERPLSEFLDAQGTFCFEDTNGDCIIFVPPIDNFVGFSAPATNRGASFDYAGLANKWIEEESGGAASFGTTITGSVKETVLPDGRARLHVKLHTQNALVWVIEGSDYGAGRLLFGNRATDVYFDGKPAALGDSNLELKIINPAPGAPIPDLEEILFTRIQDLEFLAFHGTATGVLHSLSGFEEGTIGRLTVSETAPIGTAFKNGFKGALGDGFPTENIKLQPVGPQAQ